MINGSLVLGLIPARANSKRLPGKNTKLLAGKPLIQWSIEAGRSCAHIDVVCVSTDDDKIAKISLELEADVPFIRPDELANDMALTVDVVRHAIEFYRSKNIDFGYVVLLQPTSPLRTAVHVTKAIELFIEKKADAVISVCKMEHSPLWSNLIPEDGSLRSFIRDDVKNVRSQDLSDYYRLNGAIYIVNVDRLLEQNSLFLTDNIFSYKMAVTESVDIDEGSDFTYADFLMRRR
jgi:CMP-N-acetylneuraminic acid synthetase